jgi:hypothetical protein
MPRLLKQGQIEQALDAQAERDGGVGEDPLASSLATGRPHHGMSLSSQIVNDPLALSAAWYVTQLVVLQSVLAPLGAVMPRGYQPGCPAFCSRAVRHARTGIGLGRPAAALPEERLA